jgi:hypothetical protein
MDSLVSQFMKNHTTPLPNLRTWKVKEVNYRSKYYYMPGVARGTYFVHWHLKV